MNKFKITSTLRKLMIQNNELNTLCNSNISPVVSSEDVEGNFIVLYRNKYSKEYAKGEIINENTQVFIAIVSENYDESIEIAILVNDIIEGKHIDDYDDYDCRLIDSTEEYEEKKYIQVLLFEIK